MEANRPVLPPPSGEPDRPVNRRGQHKPVVVIGVLADQVYPPGRPDDDFGRSPEDPFELSFD
jgi:hypothetical protein